MTKCKRVLAVFSYIIRASVFKRLTAISFFPDRFWVCAFKLLQFARYFRYLLFICGKLRNCLVFALNLKLQARLTQINVTTPDSQEKYTPEIIFFYEEMFALIKIRSS